MSAGVPKAHQELVHRRRRRRGWVLRLEIKLGGHDAIAADVDGDGDIDILSKIWSGWSGNGNEGRVHADWLENLSK